MPFQSKNPYTGELFHTQDFDSDQQIGIKLIEAEEAFHRWKKSGYDQQLTRFRALAQVMTDRKQKLAYLISREMGKPLRESLAEIEKCIHTTNYFIDKASEMLSPMPMQAHQKAEVHFRPLGVVFGIFPWNYPVWQVLRFAIPTLMAGNTVLFKCAENTPLAAAAIEECFNEAGFEKGCIRHVYASLDQIERIIGHPHVRAVTLTGSERAGRSVAALAGKYLKKVVLELGGSDPFLVMEDANIELAATTGAMARFQNTGQSCIAAKRFLVHGKVYDAFLEQFVSAMEKFVPSDPLSESSTMGVLARKDLADLLESQVEQSVASGASLFCGAERISDTAFTPGILLEPTPESPAWSQELFGPVASIFRIDSENQAIAIANATNFGLGASVWTSSEALFRLMAGQLECGMVYWNQMVKSTPELPFGGTKNSGIGRELSVFGIREFTNPQLLYPF